MLRWKGEARFELDHARRKMTRHLLSALVLPQGSSSRHIGTCCGTPAAFALANARHDTRSLQAFLGHKNIQHTVRYSELAPDRFKDFRR
jgi:integrase